MSDHDFEKQVQLRLEQLKLRPSTAVWAEVERNIRLQKRRRRLLIWLPAALLVMIAGGYLALQQTTRHDASPAMTAQTVETTQPANTPVSPNQIPSTDNSTSTPTDQTVPDNNTATTAAPETVTAPAATGPSSNGTSAVADTKSAKQPVRAPEADDHVATHQQFATVRPARNNKNNHTAKNNKHRQQSNDKDLAGRKPSAAASLSGVNVPAPVTKQVDQDIDKTAHTDSTLTAAVPATDTDLAQATITDSTRTDSATTTAAVTPAAKTPVVAKATPVQRKQESNKESKWQFGVTAEGGASGVSSDGLFGFLEKEAAVPDLAAAPNYNSIGNSQAFAPQFPRPPVNRASSLSMGPSFSIGAFAQRKLSNRLSLSAGLQYTLLTARQVVGNKINNDRTVNQAPASSRLVNSYYDNSASTTNKYTNKYHYLELPVTLHAQLNEGRHLPFGVDVGLSAMHLLSTTALHYDGIGNVYYKDDALFNKTQWTASAGFYLKLFNQTNYPVSLGPVMRYNMTPMLVKDFSTGQHQWSVGLRARVLLKK